MEGTSIINDRKMRALLSDLAVRMNDVNVCVYRNRNKKAAEHSSKERSVSLSVPF